MEVPFKSKAQRRKFYAMLKRGEISKAEVEEWERETGGRKLPERVSRKRSSKKPPKKRRTRKALARGRRRTKKKA